MDQIRPQGSGLLIHRVLCELCYHVPPLVINYTRDLITPLTRHWRLSFLVLAVGVGNRSAVCVWVDVCLSHSAHVWP